MHRYTPLLIDIIRAVAIIDIVTCEIRTDSMKPIVGLQCNEQPSLNKLEMVKLTISFTVCTKLVFGLLHKLSESACIAFGGGFVLTGHLNSKVAVWTKTSRIYPFACRGGAYCCLASDGDNEPHTMAAARAEARRKAILARGNDRLAKLTTSARGEDHPAYSHVGTPPNFFSILFSNIYKF